MTQSLTPILDLTPCSTLGNQLTKPLVLPTSPSIPLTCQSCCLGHEEEGRLRHEDEKNRSSPIRLSFLLPVKYAVSAMKRQSMTWGWRALILPTSPSYTLTCQICCLGHEEGRIRHEDKEPWSYLLPLLVPSPVKSAASAMRKVEYDMRTKSAVSRSGKSLSRVNLVRMAVRQPMTEPMRNDMLKIHRKLRMARKKADVSKPPLALP